ncbi:ATP-binding SpoIIE family protein phosphatase [Actinospica robiniae]|uniref:ATP-binding SpoIIE family protein phosphatase n=1 Tax=Actinospica robiniae TaxID=304901 RepID=UPI000415A30A|nr:SpoIIE family protein phosphatase [Actinospica robiniae]
MGATPWNRAFGGEAAPAAPQRPWPATLTVGTDGRITSWSRGAQALFGLSAGRACGRRMRTLMVRPEDRSALDELLGTVLTGRSWSGSLPLLDADGLVHPVECGWQPIQDRRGRPGALIVVTDRVGQSAPAAKPAPLGTAEAALAAIGQFQEHAASVAMMRRVQLLTEANTMIGTTLDMSQTARELLAVAVPRFADTASVALLETVVDEFELPLVRPDNEVRVRRVAARAQDPALEALLPVDQTVVHGQNSVFGQVLRSGRPRTLPALDQAATLKLWPSSEPSPGPLLLGHCMLVVPLVARGAVLGIAMFTRGPDRRPFSGGEAVLGEEFAARAALCVDNARLYSHERHTALMLQRALLPADSGDHTGVDVAHRYLPASDLTGVGGDWYDVIGLRGGRVAMVVGDVMGHGVRAAAVMGQLRTATRTLVASLDLQPAEVLHHLDELTEHLGDGEILFATCLVAVFDPTTRICRIARAGHIPPLMVPAQGGPQVIELPAGVPLGVGGHTFESLDIDLEDDSLLVLCTDGLVESRAPGRDIDDGLADLAREIKDPSLPLEAIADTVISGLRGDRTMDDAALVIARVRGVPSTATANWVVEPELPAVARARHAVRSTLSDWGLAELEETAELLASELVTNALLYSNGPISVRLMRDRTLLCEVYDASDEVPRLRTAGHDDDGGRGLHLVKELSHRWGTRRTTGGKSVWFELALP